MKSDLGPEVSGELLLKGHYAVVAWELTCAPFCRWFGSLINPHSRPKKTLFAAWHCRLSPRPARPLSAERAPAPERGLARDYRHRCWARDARGLRVNARAWWSKRVDSFGRFIQLATHQTYTVLSPRVVGQANTTAWRAVHPTKKCQSRRRV